jgi:hypothetical protein
MSKYLVKSIVIDSTFRDTSAYPYPNDFVLFIGETFKNVIAIRLIKSEFNQPISDANYFVLNGIATPLQTQVASSSYLYLNNYDNFMVSDGTNSDNCTNNTFFGRIVPGVDVYQILSGYPLDDPYTYIFNPPQAKLNRFHVKLLNADRSLYRLQNPAANASLVLTLSVYCQNDSLPSREERHHNTIPIDFRSIRDQHTDRIPASVQIQKTPHRREASSINRTKSDNGVPKQEMAQLNQWFDSFIITQNRKEKRKIT